MDVCGQWYRVVRLYARWMPETLPDANMHKCCRSTIFVSRQNEGSELFDHITAGVEAQSFCHKAVQKSSLIVVKLTRNRLLEKL